MLVASTETKEGSSLVPMSPWVLTGDPAMGTEPPTATAAVVAGALARVVEAVGAADDGTGAEAEAVCFVEKVCER